MTGSTAIPTLGTIVPIMGTSRQHRTTGSLADALFTTTQQRVLAQLFGQPDRSFYATELIALTGGGSGAVQRELARLEASGLIVSERRGSQKHYQANPASPLFDELCSITSKTVGLAEPLREALKPLAAQIKSAFVYGSVAKRQDTARSDIDLMVVGEVSFSDVVAALFPLHERLGREINPVVMTSQEFHRRRHESPFIERVMGHEKLWLLGSPDEP